MPSANLSPLSLRLTVALALGLGLAACSDKPAPAAPATAPAAAAAAAAEAAAASAAQQQAAALAALSADELRTRGRAALREQRIYTPAGDNAMEYYIALRKKSDKPDASAESALMDLQPYAVIAAEQALGREDFIEAERLRALISAADPQAPSLPRIADAIAKGKAAAAMRATEDATRTAEQAAAAEAARLKAIEDAKTLQAQAAAAATARTTPAAPATPAPQPAAPSPAPSTAAPPPRPVAPVPAPARAPSELVAVSTPAPEYPAAALRRGAGGSVVVSFMVNSDGSTSDIQIVSSTNGTFDRAVQSAVRRWKFRPIDGSQRVQRTINFAAPQ